MVTSDQSFWDQRRFSSPKGRRCALLEARGYANGGTQRTQKLRVSESFSVSPDIYEAIAFIKIEWMIVAIATHLHS
ncbi:MAG: hypothetical protein KME31_34695 [Tolypothrix carrinoi HA7290-LM1]|nr:hypothetical protein [Tolypothrix carrinoi HA7290-LM1]